LVSVTVRATISLDSSTTRNVSAETSFLSEAIKPRTTTATSLVLATRLSSVVEMVTSTFMLSTLHLVYRITAVLSPAHPHWRLLQWQRAPPHPPHQQRHTQRLQVLSHVLNPIKKPLPQTVMSSWLSATPTALEGTSMELYHSCSHWKLVSLHVQRPLAVSTYHGSLALILMAHLVT